MPTTPVVADPEDVEELGDFANLGRLPVRERILMADPERFAVTREDNPHTTDPDGNLNRVDRERAREQWDMLREAYEQIGLTVETVPAEPGLPDLVFCRNTVFPYREAEQGRRRFVPGRMRYEGRRGEVPVVAEHLAALGYEATPLPDGVGRFECGGDLLWLGTRRLVLAGTGERTSPKSLEAAAETIGAPFVHLQLVEADFYHLDTCLAVLDETTLAWVPAAFSKGSQRLVEALPLETIEVPETEARQTLGANLHCPDGEHVLVDEANPRTIERLEDHGYEVDGVDTSEFRKAGGSVFCMTNQLW